MVGAGYVLKVWFSKSLATGLSTSDLINRFLIKIASSESGSLANGVAQDRSRYTINYDVTGAYDELAFTLPSLYNGTPDFLHTIDVTYAASGVPTVEATRTVKARPVVTIKDIIVIRRRWIAMARLTNRVGGCRRTHGRSAHHSHSRRNRSDGHVRPNRFWGRGVLGE